MSEPSLLERPREPLEFDASRARQVRRRDLLVRFAFGAATSVVAAAVSLAFGARIGGALLAFPAILAASLTLIESEEHASAAREDARGAVVGALALACFAVLCYLLFAKVPGGVVLILATITWGVVAVGVYFALWHRRGKAHSDQGGRTLPE